MSAWVGEGMGQFLNTKSRLIVTEGWGELPSVPQNISLHRQGSDACSLLCRVTDAKSGSTEEGELHDRGGI